MIRRKPMKPGKGFQNKTIELRDRDPDRVRPTPTVRPEFRAAQPVSAEPAPAVEKENVIPEHGVYMAMVRMLPCARCSKHAPSQFCHADMDKGMGLKTDCRRGFPGCPTCHELLGSSGKIPRAERRELEAQYGRETRAKILTLGWPKRLPLWTES